MATITSVRNFTGSKSWTDTTAWQGGVIPTSADTANIYGVRTSINQAAFSAWTGVRTITVASTTSFPSSGVFYTVTECSLKVKINYTATTATQFLGCSLDTSYANWQLLPAPHPSGGTIANGTYVLYQPVIEISGITVNAGIINIANGGYLKVYDNAVLSIQDGITVDDGTFEVSGSNDILWGLNNTNASSGTASKVISNNVPLSQIIIQGTENRSNSTLTASTVVGQGYIDVSDSSGFEIGDEIIISDPNLQIYRIDNNFRATVNNEYALSGTTDEMVSVAGKSGNRIFIEKKNGIDSTILEVQSDTQIVVDSTRFNVGDIVTINNDVFTIQTVEDYDFLLVDENFSGGTTTNLNNWDTDLSRSPYFGNFSYVNNNGIFSIVQSGTTSYRHLFLKRIYRDEVKVEAWISNYRNITGGTTSGGEVGVTINSDPSMDYDYSLSNSARSFFGIVPSSDYYRCQPARIAFDTFNRLSASGLQSYGIKKFTLESRKGLIKGYFDDVQYFETYQRAGLYNGRVGVYMNNESSFNLLRYKVYATAQRLVLNKPGIFTSGMTISESGLDYVHSTGNLVIKNASILSNFDTNIPISFAYRGGPLFKNDGIFPYIYNVTSGALPVGTTPRNTNGNNFSIINCNMTYEQLFNLQFGANSGSCVFDLVSAQTFTHISYKEYPYANSMTLTSPTVIHVSNDLTNWTQVYFSATDTTRRQGLDGLRMYNVGLQNARYVRLFRGGGTSFNTTNFINNIGVHNYSSGFTFTVNNSSDFNVGDRLFVLYNGGFSPDVTESDFYTNLVNGTVPASAYTSNLQGYYTVLSKTGNTVTVDRPFTHGYLLGGERVIKLNKSVRFRGDRGTNIWKSGRWYIAPAWNSGRLIIVRNTEFTHMSYNYPTSIAGPTTNSFGLRGPANYFDASIYDRMSFYDSMPVSSSNNLNFTNLNNIIFRNSNLLGWNGLITIPYYPQFSSVAAYNVGNNYAIFIPSSSGLRSEVSSNSLIWFMYNNIYSFGNTYGYMNFTSYATNVFTRPNFNYVKRNYINGGQLLGFLNLNGNLGFGGLNNMEFEGNSCEYTDDYLFEMRRNSGYPLKNTILGKTQSNSNRTSRFNNNAGFFSPNTDQISNSFRYFSSNFNKWGYDLQAFTYGYIVKNPNEDYWKFYKFDRTFQNPIAGINIGVNNSQTVVTIEVGIEYFNDRSIQYQSANENTYSGSCVFYTLKDNSLFYPVSLIPKSLTKTAYTYTTSFTGTGFYSVGLGNSLTSGYVGIYSMYSKITTNNPNDIYVYGNNFDTSQLASIYPRDYTQFNVQRNNASIRLQGSRLY
jgi:hypothetical protein